MCLYSYNSLTCQISTYTYKFVILIGLLLPTKSISIPKHLFIVTISKYDNKNKLVEYVKT